MEKRRIMTLLAVLFLFVGSALAQTKVSGTVVSQDDGQPVIGATIQVVGTNVGTVTNSTGQFSLTCPASKNMLRITYVGMEPIEVSARPNMRILLTSDTKALDEVIVVAFGTAKKSAFTGSAKVIGSEELALSQVTSVTDALAGSVPGVQIVSSNGSPSSTGTIRIRGFGSLNAGKDPLIIVDGAPYDGDIANINPADIESMTVQKDAASNALYGARGANGVIMITTKRAKVGQDATITFDAKWGANSRALQHYDVIKDPAQYYELQYKALYNNLRAAGNSEVDAWRTANNRIFTAQNGGLGYQIFTLPEGQFLVGRDGKINPNATLGYLAHYNGEDYWITPDDWEEEGTRIGFRQEYNVNMSGASERGTFYSSLGYLSNEGLMENSDMQRFTARLRADYQVKKWLKVGANMAYTRFEHNSLGNNGSETSSGNPWAFTTEMAPIYPMYLRNADGSIKVDGNGIKIMDYGTDGSDGDVTNAGMSRLFVNNANPIQDMLLNTRQFEGNAFNGNGFAEFTIIPGLTLTFNGTTNLDETRGTYVYNPYYGQFNTTGGTVEKYHQRTQSFNYQQLANWTHTFAEMHNLNLLLGHEYSDYRVSYLSGSKSMMFSQENKELGGAAIDGQNAYSYKTRYNNEGYFGRVMYDYDGRYFGNVSLRRDASSRFDPEYQWGTFWSAGAAWLLTKEDFLKDVNWLNELKFKVSYGQQGNDNIGSYRYTDRYVIKNSAGKLGVEFDGKGTRDITWETQGNFNTGFEFELFKRVSGNIEYFYRKTSDMLYSFNVAPSLGYTSYFDNVGDMYNTGIELDLNVNILKKKDLQWDVNLNFSSIKNRITKLHEDRKTTTVYDKDGKEWKGYASGSFFVTEDASIYTWYVKDYAGVNAETGKAEWWKNTFDYFDAQGNKVTADDDYASKTWTGRERTSTWSEADYYMTNETTLPKFYGGFGTTLKAYGFDFAVNFTYQIGGKQMDGTYASFMSNPSDSHGGWNFHKDVLNAWTETNTNTDVPRWNYGDLNIGAYQTRYLTNASFLNLQNLNLGYTLPKTFTKKFDVQNLRLYLACENVYYWSKRKGFDPRQAFDDVTNATRYSPMRTISGGITVTF